MAANVSPADPRPALLPLAFWARATWIALRLVLVYYCGEQGAKFFYQGF